MIPSDDFRVWIKTEEQLHSVLNALESEGIRWRSGDEATQYIPPIDLPFGLDIKRCRIFSDSLLERRIGWSSNFRSSTSIYSAEELIEDETSANYSSVFDSMAF